MKVKSVKWDGKHFLTELFSHYFLRLIHLFHSIHSFPQADVFAESTDVADQQLHQTSLRVYDMGRYDNCIHCFCLPNYIIL